MDLNLLLATFDEHRLVYVNSLVLCIISVGVLYWCHSRHWRHKVKNPLFCCYLLLLVSLVADVIWAIIDSKKELVVLNYIVNIIELQCFIFVGYSWLYYCFDFFPYKCFHTKWMKIVAFIPAVIISLIVDISPLIKCIFFIDSEGVYHRGTLFWLQGISYLYLFTSSIIAFCSMHKEFMTNKKEHLKIIALFSLPCFMIGSIQLILPPGGLPSLQFSIFLSLFFVFVHEQEQRITVDGLTKLMNRYEFEKVLIDKMKKAKTSTGKNLFVIAGDINGFKMINDTYGHNEGDSALVLVGGVIDKVANNYKAIACRRSGDEFLMFVETVNDNIPEIMTNSINGELSAYRKNKNYNLQLSFGIVKYDHKLNIQELVNIADHRMYIQKHIMESGGKV